ncbi:hypothetical protein PBCVCvsA1_310R [Paramecium bursaria Chlorella virus CvsA1]|nr:hypothetical protein PBCVCvsA1_310R [Paramecium bursaria Chlorella virus CvsA1]
MFIDATTPFGISKLFKTWNNVFTAPADVRGISIVCEKNASRINLDALEKSPGNPRAPVP